MGKINMGRVLLGGLLAGVVVNLLEFVQHGLILSKDWTQAMEALGRHSGDAGMANFMVIVNLQGFLVGILGVWLYAAIRPRFGAGPGTAARAGVALWAMAVLAPTLIQLAFNLFPPKLIWGPLAGDFVICLLAVVIGAMPYQEAA